MNHSLGLSKRTTGNRGDTGKKEEKALWKKGSAHLLTKFIPVFPVFPVVGLHSQFNSRLGLNGAYRELTARRTLLPARHPLGLRDDAGAPQISHGSQQPRAVGRAFEAGGVADDPGRHVTAIAPSGDGQPVLVR